MPMPRKVVGEYAELFARVFRARQQIPSDKELARKAGVSPETVRNYMRSIRQASVGSRGTTSATIGGNVSAGHTLESRDAEVP